MMDARLVPFLPLVTTEQALTNAQNQQLPLLVLPEGTPGSADYEDKLDKLFEQLHNVLWQQSSAHGVFTRNPLTNYQVFEGELDAANHRDVLAPWSAPGLQVLQDYSFFSANESILSGMLQEAGLRFATATKGPAWEEAKRQQVAKAGAEETLRMVAASMQQSTGQDVSPALTDESVHVPQATDEWAAPLPQQQQLEAEIYERLNEALTLGLVEKKLLDTFRDRYIVNTELAHIIHRNGQPDVEPLRLDEVNFWGRPDAQDADEMDAWAIRKQRTLSQIIARYGSMLEAGGSMKETLAALGGLGGSSVDNLMRRYTDGTLNQMLESETSPLLPGYDSRKNGGPASSVTEQRIYVKLIETLWFMLLTDVETDGTPCPLRELSKEEYADYTKGRYVHHERIIYEKMTAEQASQAKQKGATSVRAVFIATLYDSVRLGNKVLYRRPMPWQEREPGRLTTPQFPIAASFGRDSSLVTKGRPLHEVYTNVMILLRKKVALGGVKAVAYDSSQLPKGYSIERVMWEAKEVGIMFFNGQRIGGAATKDSYKHLQPVELGMDDDVVRLLSLAAMLHDSYDRLCGITPALKGQYQSRETLGQTQMGVTRGTLATNRLFYEHSLFVQDVLSKMVSLGKYVWPRQSSPRAKGATLETVRQIPLNYYGVYLENTLKAQKDKDFLMQIAQQGISSGAASWGEIIRLYYAESPLEALSILENGLTAYERQQQEAQQNQAQTGQAMAQAAQVKAEMPAKVAEITGQWHIEIEKMRQEFEGKLTQMQLNFEGDAIDIQNQTEVKRDLIRAAGQQELAQQNQPSPPPAP